MKKVFNIIKYPFFTTIKGFRYICYVLSKGFYFYFASFFGFLYKLLKLNVLEKLENHFRRRAREPEFLALTLSYVFSIVLIAGAIYVPNQHVVNLKPDYDSMSTTIQGDVEKKEIVENKQEEKVTTGKYSNLYQFYGKMSPYNVSLESIRREVNEDAILWLSVDGTNINYPIVKTINNDYYLNHSISKRQTSDGWTFMDYRNSTGLTDTNTIFYGHNLLNKTSFGSISNVFTQKWFNSSNRQIKIFSDSKIYTYQIFSIYYSEPITDYLKITFLSTEYDTFLYNLVEKSLFNFETEVSSADRIITLSTCTEDNNGRKVVHAKLINMEDR